MNDLKKLVDVIFDIVYSYLPFHFKLLANFVKDKIVELLDKVISVKEVNVGLTNSPEELKVIIQSVFNIAVSFLKDKPHIADIVAAFGRFITNYLIGVIWDRWNSEMRPGFERGEEVYNSTNVHAGITELEADLMKIAE